LTGVQITHVPYRGTAQSVVDLLEGRMELLVGAINSTQEFVRSGRLTAFAVLSKQRVAVLPDVPTAAEAGVPGCQAELWSAIVMQAGVPRPIVGKLNQAVNDVVSMSQIQDSLHQQGVAVESGNQADVASRIGTDIAKWRDVIVSANIGKH
jgi:tripartite-type tricarboxylate transporter receptor subunit TctC